MQIANTNSIRDLAASLVVLNDALQKVNTAFASVISDLEDDEWMGISKASKLTGLTPRQLRYRAENGAIRTKMNGKNYLFYSKDLVAFRN